MMNIFELTRILNESDVIKSTVKAISDLSQSVDDIKTSNDKRSQTKKLEAQKEKDEFIKKIGNLALMKKDELTSSSSQKKYINIFLERMKRFLASETRTSHQNDVIVCKDILAEMPESDIKVLLGIPIGKGNHKPKKRELKSMNLSYGIQNTNALKRLETFAPGTCGAFEMLLGIVFDGTKVTGHEKGQIFQKGDVNIDGVFYEVKKNETGGIDTGWKQFQYMFNKTTDQNEKKRLGTIIKKLKVQQKNECDKMFQKVSQFVKERFNYDIQSKSDFKNENGKQTISNNDDVAVNYFALLDDDDKKRAILFGFYEIGYKNIIVCDDNHNIVVVTSDMIQQFVNGSGHIQDLGIDVNIPNELNDEHNAPKTAAFQKIKIKIA